MQTVKIFADDTIYALSTAGSKAAIGVIRVSGPETEAILQRICRRRTFEDRRATVARIFDEHGNSLDRALLIRFVSPRSFTGEDMVEFHVTGGRAVISGLLRALRSCAGTRLAEPGEFARRAFENGKIDLAEVEGLASVVEAETNAQLRHALTMASGELSRQCESVRSTLLNAMAQLEAILDFSDVEDASAISVSDVLPGIRQASMMLGLMLEGQRISERLRNGMTVVIAGPPNAGKSTLLNYLAKRDIAIVSPFPGTTRDVLEVATEVDGFPIIFADTAGFRETLDPLEAEGVARAKKRSASADLVLWLSDSDSALPPEAANWPVLAVRTKVDLTNCPPGGDTAAISAKTGEGVAELVKRIAGFAATYFADVGRVSVGTDRQHDAAGEALNALRQVVAEPNRQVELIAEDLRSAVRALGRISGRIGVEEILGEIFSRLCVGK